MTKHAENLRSIAQNDYMVDQHMLPTGKELEAAADCIDSIRAQVERHGKVIKQLSLACAALLERAEKAEAQADRIRELEVEVEWARYERDVLASDLQSAYREMGLKKGGE